MRLFKILKSNYCKFVFLVTLIFVYFILPKNIFYTNYGFLAGIFMFTTAISVTCITRTIKENVTAGLKIKKSFLSSIASAFGILTIQACGLSAPICGASVGASVVATFFPSIMFAVLDGYGNYLLFLAIISQLVGIYLMKCFKN